MRLANVIARSGHVRCVHSSWPRTFQQPEHAHRTTLLARCSLALSGSAVARSLHTEPKADRAVEPLAKDEKDGTAIAQIQKALPMEPRRSFALPSQVPSWYAGHMYRAMRSLPSLLARNPPPIIIEARDARLPISSINPAFEELLTSMERMVGAKDKKGKGMHSPTTDEQHTGSQDAIHGINDLRAWRQRRLILYNKADLIDERLHEPLRKALAEHEGRNDNVMLVDSRDDRSVRTILRWIKQRALQLEQAVLQEGGDIRQEADDSKTTPGMGRLTRSAQPRNLSGAFKHTPTPDNGVRLVILGMPNVGKSSLLNALRRVGTGGGKAASTAPEPGHTRKLTGTVRITPKKKNEGESTSSKASQALEDTGIYVYDTPGVMVPFLGGGQRGAEKGVKLAVAAGIKSSLFDAVGLADYLLYRLNLQWAWRWQRWAASHGKDPEPLPAYLTGLPMGKPESPTGNGGMAWAPTNDIIALLNRLALRAPGTLSKGGERDLDAAAKFMLDRWRNGKLGSGELDLECFEEQPQYNAAAAELSPSASSVNGKRLGTTADSAHITARITAALARHRDEVELARRAGAATSYKPVQGADRASRRSMERVPWQELRAQHESEQRRDTSPLDSGASESDDRVELAYGAEEAPASHGSSATHAAHDTSSHLLSKHQVKRRQRAIELAIRENRLREKGVAIRGLLPANRLRPSKSHRGHDSRRRLRGAAAKQ